MDGADEAGRAFERAQEALARFDAEAAVAHLSAAVRGYTGADEPCRAAMACVLLGDTMANSLGNLTAGRAWFARARRLLADEPACIEQGWVAVAAMGCEVDDPAQLLADAELALDRARRFGDVNLETKALADGGLAHVQAGRVAEGMALLDEAMALACGPADDMSTAAKSVCSFFTACYHTADFERAASWADLFRRRGLLGTGSGGQLFLSSHCDSVQATLLMELGRWSEAEAVLTRATTEFEAATGIPAYHPAIALADLRIRQRRLADAEALLLGKEQAMQALLPTARLYLARGELPLARAAARRGLRALRDDRLRALELLHVLVETELADGDLVAAGIAGAELADRVAEVDVPSLRARSDAVAARLLAATGRSDEAVSLLEATVDRLEGAPLPWLHALLLVDLARWRDQAGDPAAARLDARSAAAMLRDLDVVTVPSDGELLERLTRGEGTGGAAGGAAASGTAPDVVELSGDGRGWTISHGGVRARLADSKGLRYLAVLVGQPGVEHHALDLVDRVEGVAAARGVDRRSLGDAGEILDGQARAAYRLRVEALRADIDEALEAGRLESAETLQAELDTLVAELARAFGLGGRERRAASAAERARLNVTRAVRTAIRKVGDVLPEAGAALDRSVRTGIYCRYGPADRELRWVVASAGRSFSAD